MCVGREWQWWEIGYIKGGDLIGKCVKGKEAQVFTAERELQVAGESTEISPVLLG